jgi:hypothetical protein
LNVYPNPVKHEFTITLNALKSLVNISIKDIHGKQVYQRKMQQTNNVKMDIGNLQAGVYIVHISDIETSEIVYYKIIKD